MLHQRQSSAWFHTSPAYLPGIAIVRVFDNQSRIDRLRRMQIIQF